MVVFVTHLSWSHIYNEAKGRASQRDGVTSGNLFVCYKEWPSDTYSENSKKLFFIP